MLDALKDLKALFETPPEEPPPFELEAVVRSLRPRIQGRDLLVGTGIVCGFDGYTRMGVVGLEAGVPEEIWEGYVPTKQVESMREALSEVAEVTCGKLDFYHATRWKLAWTKPPAPFRLVARNSEHSVYIDGEELVLWRPVRRKRIALDAIDYVAGRVSSGWLKRSVVIGTSSGEREVFSQFSLMPVLISTYDGLDLMGDTLWVEHLSRTMAEALDVDCDLEDL